MKLVDLCEYYAPQGGGVRVYIEHKLHAASRHGVEAVIVAPGPTDREERVAGGRIIWVRSPPLPFDARYHVFAAAGPVHRLLDRERPDVLEVSSLLRAPWIAAGWQGAAPRALFFHSDPLASYAETLFGRWLSEQAMDRIFAFGWAYLRRLQRHFDGSVVAGDWLAERLARHGLARPSVVPLGIEKDRFRPDLRKEEVRRSLLAACGVDDPAGRLLLVVGRLHPEKRIVMLLEAFARLRRDHPVGLCIIGDGPLRRRIARAAHRRAGVHFAGPIRDRDALARVMASADLLLHGCASETFGIVIGEALCAGLPIVVPDRGGARALAREDFAEIYRAGDAADCTRALGRMLRRTSAQTRAAAARFGEESLCAPAAHFGRLFELYERLASGPRRDAAVQGILSSSPAEGAALLPAGERQAGWQG